MSEKEAKPGIALEQRVAQAYRRMGARKVEHDVEMAGHQIDVYVELETAVHSVHRIAVEAKDYKRSVGIDVIRRFGDVADSLRRLGEIDEGMVVGSRGFSRQAGNGAEKRGLRLLTPEDLEALAERVERGERWTPPPYVPPTLSDFETLAKRGRLPPHSRFDFRPNALFTGREEALKTLARALLGDGARPTLVTQAVAGMGGVGKTQLAVEFAYRYGRFFHGVHWINCAQSAAIGAEVAACGEAMCLPYWPEKLPEQVARTVSEWRRGGARLVVLDNLEEVGAAREWLGRLSGGGARVLVTARWSDWPDDMGLSPLRLAVFTEDESRAFLREYLPEGRATDGELDALAERLGHLPLALELAGRYLKRMGRVTVGAYLEKLEEIWSHPSMAGWREDLGNPTGHDLDLAATFAVSWERVADENTRRLFLLTGYCTPNRPIPPKLLEWASGLEVDNFDEARGMLVGMSLLEREDPEAGPLIHPLLAKYAANLDDDYPDVLPALVNALTTLTHQANEADSPIPFASLRPHAEAVATAAEEAGLDWTKRWELHFELGKALVRKGDPEAASKSQAKGLTLLPKEPSVEAARLHLLGAEIGASQAHLDRIECESEQALKLAEAIGAKPELALAHRSLASVARSRGDPNLAMEHLEISAKVWPEPENLAELANRYGNLGILSFEIGNWAQAEEFYLRAFEMHKRIGSKFGIALACCNLADLYRHQGVERGLACAWRGLKIANELEAYPAIIFAHAVLAPLYWRRGDMAQAHAELLEARKLIKTHGVRLFEATVARWLAQVYLTERDVAQAEAEIQPLLSLTKEDLREEYEPVQRLRGQILSAQGDLDEAAQVLQDSLTRLEQGEEPYQIGRTRLALGRVLAQMECRTAEALGHAKRAREIFANLGARPDMQEADRLIAELSKRASECG